MKQILIIFSFLAAFSVAPALAQSEGPQGPYVQVRLIPERNRIQANEELPIAIEQIITPGWHTYWKNPGDSGAAPRVKWMLPEGFITTDIEWPVPGKISYGPLLNYGYSNGTVLLQKIKAPATLPEGPITLKADIDILVCMEICIPETGTYELTLNDPNAAEENNKKYFQVARNSIPVTVDYESNYEEKDGVFIITTKFYNKAAGYENIHFIPEDWGLIENAATPTVESADDHITIKQKRGERSLNDVQNIRGLIAYDKDGEYFAVSIAAGKKASSAAQTQPATALQTSFLQALILALLGGLVLNLMPCVFPVLSIKALSLVKISEKNPALARLHGLAYTAGIIISFLTIAGALLALKSTGSQIGWGFQLQNPLIVTALAYLLFIIGLNMSGMFDIGNHFGNVGNRLTTGNTPGHSFFTGVLATLVATPCTAPFMGVAIGYALVQSAGVSLLIFAALGLGLALPYLVLSFIPALQKILPRPGAWMETFKQLLAFPMYASAAWLVWVISQQSGAMGVLAALMGLVSIAFGIWLLRHAPARRFWNYTVKILALAAFIAAIAIIPGSMKKDPASASFGEPWSAEKLSTLLETTSDPVFVEMTAAWCITCKVNHAVAINTDSTRRIFTDNNVKYLLGDWTNQDPAITEFLNRYGRNGVPIYVYYGPKDASGTRPEPVVMPQILTPGIVSKAVTGI